MAIAACGHAQVQVTSSSYSQDFNTLASTGSTNSWQNNSTLAGWYAFREMPVGTFNPVVQYNATVSSQQALYSFGAATGPTSGDRALGSIAGQSTAVGGTFYYGVGFTNALAATITDASITYRGETWWVGSAPTSTVEFQFSLNASGINDLSATWLDFDALDLSAATTLPHGASNGNLHSTLMSGTLSNLMVANGSTLWIRWKDPKAASGTEFGLGIDDFNINFTMESGDGGGGVVTPEPFTMVFAGMGVAAVWRRKVKDKRR